MAGGSQKGSHKKWATKTRTGCITCKKRRVKCDEARPECQRCVLHRVECHYDDKKKATSLALTGWEILTPSSHSFGSSAPLQDQTSPSAVSTDMLRRSSTSSVASPSNLSGIRIPTPYQTTDEQTALKFWLNRTAPMMTRSDVGAYFWTVSIPTVAWDYQPLRNALVATAMIFNSLLRRDSPEEYGKVQRKAVTHVNETIRELLTNDNMPPEVIILTSTVFWILEITMGNADNGAMHFASAANIARQLDLKSVSDPLVARFVISCVDGLATTVNPRLITNKSVEERERQTRLRSEYSSRILKHACSTLQSFQKIIGTRETPNQVRALDLLHEIETEFIWTLERWPEDKVAEHDNQEYVQQVINEQTPFNGILNRLVSFLESDDIIEMTKFDVEMKTTLEHFLWLAGSRTLAERQHTFNMVLSPDRPKRITKRSLIMAKETLDEGERRTAVGNVDTG